MMTDGEVYAEILRAQGERRSGRVYPDHATLLEMRGWAFREGVPDASLLASLRRLRESGRITAGRTLNGVWIRAVPDGGKPPRDGE